MPDNRGIDPARRRRRGLSLRLLSRTATISAKIRNPDQRNASTHGSQMVRGCHIRAGGVTSTYAVCTSGTASATPTSAPAPRSSACPPNQGAPRWPWTGHARMGRVSSRRPLDAPWAVLAPWRALSSQKPTSRCRSATAGRQVRARESPPGAGHAATGTRVAPRPRPRLPARPHERP